MARLAVSLLMSLSVVAPLTAQQAAVLSMQRDPQALALLAQSLWAVGGTGPTVVDSVSTGTLTYADGRSGPITIKTKGASLRQEMSFPEGPVVHIVANGTGAVVANGKRASQRFWQTQYQKPQHIFAASRIADLGQGNTRVVYVGLEQVTWAT
jgi:hypothetical protein